MKGSLNPEADEPRRLIDIARRTASEHPDRIVLSFEGRDISYKDLLVQVDDFVAVLHGAGVRAGDRIAHYGLLEPNYMITYLAAGEIGAIWVGLNPKYTERELRHVLGDSEPCVILAAFSSQQDHTPLASAVSELPNACLIALSGRCVGWTPVEDRQRASVDAGMSGNADLAAIVYTSGTTGAPKGALLRHSSIVHAGKTYHSQVFRGPREKVPYFLAGGMPINHVGVLCDITATVLCAEGAVLLMEQFEPNRIPHLIEKHGITLLGMVPTMWRHVVDAPEFKDVDWSSLEVAAWSGAPMPMSIAQTLHSMGFQLSNFYGLTEATGSVTFCDPNGDLDHIVNTVGYPVELDNFRLWDDGASVTEPGAPGEIQLRGPLLFAGYFRNDEANAKSFVDGEWFRTGDIAEWTDDGSVKLIGRSKEMFKSGGYNVYPREVEEVIEEHPLVAQSVVIPQKDDLYTEVGCAFVIRSEPLDEQILRAWCKERLANYKVPKRFIFRSDFPMLPSGKADKSALKALLQSP